MHGGKAVLQVPGKKMDIKCSFSRENSNITVQIWVLYIGLLLKHFFYPIFDKQLLC